MYTEQMSTDVNGKRCICGQSAQFPLCDHSHASHEWACHQNPEHAADAFICSPSLLNLASRLAHRFSGISLHDYPSYLRVERLVIVTDGHGLALIKTLMERVHASHVHVLCIGVDPSTLSSAFVGAKLSALKPHPDGQIWAQVEEAILNPNGTMLDGAQPSVFLSHAVKDEPYLQPVIETLRTHLGVDIFVCADSIPSGSRWQSELVEQLRRRDLFIFVNSAESQTSVFCAFETGMAAALDKPMRIICLHSTPIPTHLQHIQGLDIDRLRARKPWLTDTTALFEAFLSALTPDSEHALTAK